MYACEPDHLGVVMTKFIGALGANCIRHLKHMAAKCGAFILLTLASMSATAQSTQNLVGFWYKPSEAGWGLWATVRRQG